MICLLDIFTSFYEYLLFISFIHLLVGLFRFLVDFVCLALLFGFFFLIFVVVP